MKKIFAITFSFVLVIGLIPTVVFSSIDFQFAYAQPAQNSQESIDYGIPGEDFVEGEIIALVKGGAKALVQSGAFAAPASFGSASIEEADVSSKSFNGASATIAGSALTIDETLMTTQTTQAQVNLFNPEIANDEDAYAKALQEAQREEAAQDKVANGDARQGVQNSFDSADAQSNKDDYSIVLIKTSSSDINVTIQALQKLDCVQFASPNEIVYPEYTKADATGEPMFDKQWYSDPAATDSQYSMNATTAYNNLSATNQNEVVVAVVDSGVDYTHPDLAGSMWNKGLDYQVLKDLGGGQFGVNTSGVGDTSDPMDKAIGHGTHCASTIANTWKNNEGIAGVNGNAKIMACCWLGAEGGATSNAIKAYNYLIEAKKTGVNLVAANNSWGPSVSFGYATNFVEFMCNAAGELGIVSCIAAGNSSFDHDRFINQAYKSPYIITVGAAESGGGPAYFSDYGKTTVDVFSPGTQILAATSLYSRSLQMASQYLPWLQPAADSIFYENFEGVTPKVNVKSYIDNAGSPTVLDASGSIQDKGYCDGHSAKANLFNSSSSTYIAVGDQAAIEMTLSDFPTTIAESEQYHLAFQGGFVNANFSTLADAKHAVEVEYKFIDNSGGSNVETWEKLENPTPYRILDTGWNVASFDFDKETMDKIAASAALDGNKVHFRVTGKALQATDSSSYFYIDNIGFGTKASNYYYSNGTSMATPCTTGVVSMCASAMDHIPNCAADAKSIIAKVKGGVERTGKLNDVCTTKGFVQANCAFQNTGFNPVPNEVVLDSTNFKATIKGSYFGDTPGTVTVAGETKTVDSWSDSEITIGLSGSEASGMLEYVVTQGANSGRNFASFRTHFAAKGYTDMQTGDFTYTTGDLTYNTKDLYPVRMASNNNGILVLLAESECHFAKFEYYDFATNNWSQVDFPNLNFNDEGTYQFLYSMVGAGDEFYCL
ncbi:MAG: S8 family serine peptidase, partial [Coriobacteriales bacterium]|nr:S8 family serine peptidase [Coriobacteriales bacterium]